MKILVTGGAGYIGSIFVEQLVEAGESVVVFDNLYQGHREAVHPGAAFVRGDLADRAAVDALMAQGFEAETVVRVARLVEAAEYKRRQSPPGVKVTPRAFGKDRRLPITSVWVVKPRDETGA